MMWTGMGWAEASGTWRWARSLKCTLEVQTNVPCRSGFYDKN